MQQAEGWSQGVCREGGPGRCPHKVPFEQREVWEQPHRLPGEGHSWRRGLQVHRPCELEERSEGSAQGKVVVRVEKKGQKGRSQMREAMKCLWLLA